MKVNELSKDTKLQSIKVRLPNYVFEYYQKYNNGKCEEEMWLVGRLTCFDEFFLSQDPPAFRGKY